MVKHILFDFDGTLFDTVRGVERSVQYSLRKQGIDEPLDALKCFAGPPLREKYKEKYGFDEETILELIRDFKEDYIPYGLYESAPFPGIGELLDELRQAGRKLAVTTLKPVSMAQELLERYGMENKLDVICGLNSDVGENMTKAEIVGKAMKFFGSTAEDTVLVGDTKYDVYGGHEAGIKVIAVRYGYAAEGELEEAHADVIVDTLDDLRKLLLK